MEVKKYDSDSSKLKMRSQIRDLCRRHWGMIRPLSNSSDPINSVSKIRVTLALFTKEDQTGNILGYVKAEAYESIYSDPGLNVFRACYFPFLRRGIGQH